MGIHSEAKLNRKFMEFAKLMNIYLNHFPKHEKFALSNRMLIGLSRPGCLSAREVIVRFLRERLGLELSKSTIQKVRKGVNFCGYRTWKSRIFVRKHSLYKLRKSVKKEHQESVVSLLGHAKRTNSLGYMLKMMKEGIRNGKNLQLPKGYRRAYHLHPAGA